MATLTGRTISASYTELLKTTNSAGLTSTLDVVEDGDATQSAFQISTAGIKSTGTLEVTGLSTLQSLALASGVTATGIIDDDTMATAAATNLATAESIKAYADTKQDAVTAGDGLSFTGATLNAEVTQTELDAKQDAVTAGTGLSFSGATLNAEVTQAEVDAKQDTVTAGDGLSFTGATLNAEVTQTELDAKQDTVTAGDGLSFTGSTLNAEVTQAELDAIDQNAMHTGDVTGSTALTIADNVVDEANLKIDNAPTNDYVLTAKSSAAGGLTWAAAPGASGGQNNTGSNLGTGGKDVFKEMSGAVLQFRQLKAGTNVTLTENADDITIDASGGGGSGDMTGVDITAGDGLEISQSNTTSGDYTATVSADLKANGGLVIESGEIAVDLGASTITGTLADGDIASAATWNAKQDALTHGIANTNTVKVDAADVADDDFARFTANGLEGRSASEVLSDIGASASSHNHSGVYEPADADISKTDVATEWTATQNFNSTTLTYDATQDWDLATNQVCQLTLTGNTTFDAPSNIKDGGFYSITIIQDGTGSRTAAWNSVFKWAGGTAPTLTTAASAKDIFVFRGDGTNLLEVGRQLNVS